MAKRKPPAKKNVTPAKAKKDLLAIERAAKREAQKAQGAFDGRFRVKVVKSRKRYVRKPKHDEGAE